MEKVGDGKHENYFKAPCNYKDAEHPSFWECRLKPNPRYVGTADKVCVVMSECLVVTIDLQVCVFLFVFVFLSVFACKAMYYLVHALYASTRTPRHNLLMTLLLICAVVCT